MAYTCVSCGAVDDRITVPIQTMEYMSGWKYDEGQWYCKRCHEINMQRNIDFLSSHTSTVAKLIMESAMSLNWMSAFSSGFNCSNRYKTSVEQLKHAEEHLNNIISQANQLKSFFATKRDSIEGLK